MNPFPWSAALTNLAITAAVVLLLMIAALVVAVQVRGGRHDGIDVVWGLGFVIISITTLILSTGDGDRWRQLLITGLTAIWGLRLAWHIGRRNHGKPEDQRYVDMLAKAPGNPTLYAFRKIYLTQGVVMWIVSWPVQLGQYGYSDSPLAMPGSGQESHPPAPTDPDVTLSRHPARAVLLSGRVAQFPMCK